jgi:phosphoglycerate dehydrogenase-like enzyme
MKVVIAEPISPRLNQLIIDNRRDWTVYDTELSSENELIERIKDADIASSYSVKFSKKVLDSCPKLRYLAIPAVGAGAYVDTTEAARRGITVMYCPGYNKVAVAEMAIGLTLDVMRQISNLANDLKSGHWEFSPQKGSLLSGKRVLLVGYGNIGKNIEKLLQGWDTVVTPINSKSSDDELEDGLKSADVVYVCCALNPKTEGLLTAQRLKMLKPSAVLVNVSRGAVLDEDALYDLLITKTIAGAGLDVYQNEPQPSETVPANIQRFIDLDNTVCLSHIAASSIESSEMLGQMIYESIESALSGKPINIFNH